ncbi:hypothetical protein [Pseudomonas sp. RIT-PI-AD]|uniref:hypothetical protein n=1 Tax=Pseudomonas sp. RIT-PI-AD TaxID=3035294 RepID=UPI0021DA34E7|nr:hypothetical protein [Pseudomonas sp. RIT-PI-AD]
MTSTDPLSPADASTDASPAGEPAQAEIPAFEFPFSPGQFLKAKNEKNRPPKGHVSQHDKRPGPAPRGTRRSMGKR